ncbi:MAG: DUF1385 domain-containing protein [Ndongobacter sp.]|nr:DUF1385 domain-containing protein [Ndongobacter sp.]
MDRQTNIREKVRQTEVKYTTIGGQALLEGILMKGPFETAIATRSADGTICLKTEPVSGLAKTYPVFRKPFFRGIAALVDSMTRGMKAIEYSAEQAGELGEDEKPGLLEKLLGKRRAEKVESTVMTVVLAAAVIGLFFFLPTWVTSWMKPVLPNVVLLNLFEGVLRVLFFLGYVWAISRIPELKRVFMYHGAEHKSIACYEHGEELTVENVRKYPRLHPRCGTSFLANLVLLSAILLSFFGWPNPLLRLLIRLLILPVLIGLTYELNLWMGRNSNAFSRLMQKPGLFVQRVATVREPSDDMIEVAIEALKAVIPEDAEADRW